MRGTSARPLYTVGSMDGRPIECAVQRVAEGAAGNFVAEVRSVALAPVFTDRIAAYRVSAVSSTVVAEVCNIASANYHVSSICVSCASARGGALALTVVEISRSR